MTKAEEYKNKISKLFEKWKNKAPENGINHKENVFISDGVVEPKIWFGNEIRPLFLLKEAYSKSRTADWDLIENWLKTNSSLGSTWRCVSQWTYGIFNTTDTDIPKFKKLPDIGKWDDGDNKWINKIAVMNVKKSNGNPISDFADITNYAEHDKKMLFEQLEIIDPTVIICGNTFEYLEKITGQNCKKSQGVNENWYYTMVINNHPVIVIDYFHPADHTSALLKFYGLVSIYQQALKSIKTEEL